MRIILATTSKNKVKDMKPLLEELGLEILTMKEAGFDAEIYETGSTFIENSSIKANAVAAIFPNDIIIAEDSGFCIDFFNGEPGVYSHRFMGKDTPIDEKCKKILEAMAGVPENERGARLECAVTVMYPDGIEMVTTDTVHGLVATAKSKIDGYAFDRIFYLPEYKATMSELPVEEMNKISHRTKALIPHIPDIKAYLDYGVPKKEE